MRARSRRVAGYDSFWLPEAWERESFSTLAEIATQTERIGLATGIINVFSRSPALIAMGAATIDEISGGRFRLGLGTSGARVIEDLHGIRLRKAAHQAQGSRLDHTKLASGERVDFDGECFKVARFKLGFKPVRADIPIYIAALSSKSLVQLGEIADGWLPTHWPRAELARGIAEIQAGAERAARDAKRIDIAPFVNVVGVG